jgi:hypothetical protein
MPVDLKSVKEFREPMSSPHPATEETEVVRKFWSQVGYGLTFVLGAAAVIALLIVLIDPVDSELLANLDGTNPTPFTGDLK